MTSTDVPASSEGNALSDASCVEVASRVPLTVTMLSGANVGPLRLAPESAKSPVFPEASGQGGPGFGLVGLIGLFGWWSYGRILLVAGRRKYGPGGHSNPQLAPKKKAWVPLWMRWTAMHEYELVEQHDA